MMSIRQRLLSLPSLGAGIIAGLVVVLIARRSGEVAPVLVVLVSALPFLLAALTGIAKTTTV